MAARKKGEGPVEGADETALDQTAGTDPAAGAGDQPPEQLSPEEVARIEAAQAIAREQEAARAAAAQPTAEAPVEPDPLDMTGPLHQVLQNLAGKAFKGGDAAGHAALENLAVALSAAKHAARRALPHVQGRARTLIGELAEAL